MDEYKVLRTETADLQIRQIVLYIAENFDYDTALRKLDELEASVMELKYNPYMGEIPRYPVLRRRNYRVLILKKDLIFYKINEKKKEIVIYAVFNQRQDFLSILKGL